MSSELAKAKINLTLEVLGKRRDGYHELNSLVAFANCGDSLSLKTQNMQDLIISGPFASGLEGENLILKAANFITSTYPDVQSGVFSLDKRLPIASGIGGGSADAAAAIRLLSSQISGVSEELDLTAIARELGADIPVCIAQKPVMMTGIGDTLTPIGELAPLHAVLVNPGVPVSTGEIFRRLNASEVSVSDCSSIQIPSLADFDDVLDYMAHHDNDLQAVAEGIEPAVVEVINNIQDQDGCRIARMSGSGATCFGIFENDAQTQRAVSEISRFHEGWWVQSCIIS